MKSFLSLVFACTLGVAFAADDKKFDAEKMVGKWKLTDGKMKGKALSDEGKKGLYEISKNEIHIKGDDGKDMFVMKYSVDAKAATIDMEITVAPVKEIVGGKGLGIVELDGDTLKLCYDPEGKNRPAKMDGEGAYFFTLKREKEEKKEEKKK